MHAFDVLGEPVRRRIVELLSGGELSAGQVTHFVAAEFGISQPTVSGHLRVLRENGFASVRQEGTRRLYAIEPAPLREVDHWLEGFRRFWHNRPTHRPPNSPTDVGGPARTADHSTSTDPTEETTVTEITGQNTGLTVVRRSSRDREIGRRRPKPGSGTPATAAPETSAPSHG